jgi:hypothetical protein
MTAEDARKISNEAQAVNGTGRVAEQLDRIYLKIRQAAKRGDTSVNPHEDLLPNVKVELNKQGYNITTDSDIRDGDSWTIISW